MRRTFTILAALIAATTMWATSAVAQGHGSSGMGTLYGDLITIERTVDGVPVYVWVEAIDDEGEPFTGWCLQPIDATGARIPLGADCDIQPAYLDRVVEVHFGRLNAARARPHVGERKINEVINTIKAASYVTLDEAGRLKLGWDCAIAPTGDRTCEYTTIDSPTENLALYKQLMLIGHFQTDPLAIEEPAGEGEHGGGDPAVVRYRPALGPEDWLKFDDSVKHLLPRGGNIGQCWSLQNVNGVQTPVLGAGCLEPEAFGADDFARAASFMAGGADKTGHITVDLVQYINRIMGVTSTHVGLVGPAANDPAPVELFVDFRAFAYTRATHHSHVVSSLVADGSGGYAPRMVPIMDWLGYIDPPGVAPKANIAAFVQAANDALRTIEFVHNYEVPAVLWPATTSTYGAPGCTVPQSPVGLTASVVNFKVTVSWQAVAGAAGYRLEVGSATDQNNIAVMWFGDATTYSTTAPAGTYYVRVHAVNLCGVSETSAEAMVTVPNLVVPSAPTNLVATVVGRTVTLTWAAPAGGAEVTGYVLQAGTAPGLADLGSAPLGMATTVGVPNVAPGTYYVRVLATNAAGTGPASNEVTVVVTP